MMTGVCSRSAMSSASAEKSKHSLRRRRDQHHVLRIAVRCVHRRHQVSLLRARRHAGGRTGALHVDEHRRNLGEICETQELTHQRKARATRCGEGARAVPCRADDHADGGEFVFRLHDRELLLAGFLFGAEAVRIALERFGHRRGRRDRIPRAHRGAAVHGAQRGRGVAFDHDPLANGVTTAQLDGQRIVEVVEREVAADFERMHVRLDQRVLAFVLLRHHAGEHVEVDVDQRRQRTDINDVLEQLALFRILEFGQQQRRDRHADVDHVGCARVRVGAAGSCRTADIHPAPGSRRPPHTFPRSSPP